MNLCSEKLVQKFAAFKWVNCTATAWKALRLEYVELTKVFRQDDTMFVKILRDIRDGDTTAVGALETMLAAERPESSLRGVDDAQTTKRVSAATKLVSTHEEADRINREALAKLRSAPVIYAATDSVEVDERFTAGLTSSIQLTHSLKAPGFNP